MSTSNKEGDGNRTVHAGEIPTVGVIIPCHNHAQYIKNALRSVCQQDYSRKFIAILDDGSTDGSYDAITSMMKDDTFKGTEQVRVGMIEDVPVMLLRNEKGTGPSAARNKLLKHSSEQAHIFAMLDADDEFLPGKLSKAVAKILKDPQKVGLVYTDHMIRNIERGTTTYEARQPYDRFTLERENIISNAPIVNRLAFDKVGLYDEELRTCEDWDLYLRITEHFYAIHIPEPLQVYTVTGENATFTVDKKLWEMNWRRVQQKMKQRNAS